MGFRQTNLFFRINKRLLIKNVSLQNFQYKIQFEIQIIILSIKWNQALHSIIRNTVFYHPETNPPSFRWILMVVSSFQKLTVQMQFMKKRLSQRQMSFLLYSSKGQLRDIECQVYFKDNAVYTSWNTNSFRRYWCCRIVLTCSFWRRFSFFSSLLEENKKDLKRRAIMCSITNDLQLKDWRFDF